MPNTSPTGRRLRLCLRKPKLAPYGLVRPTVVIAGRGHPAQWGTGTWLVTGDDSTTVSVYLFNRMWTFGRADLVVETDHPGDLEYVAPILPFLRGRLTATPTADPAPAR